MTSSIMSQFDSEPQLYRLYSELSEFEENPATINELFDNSRLESILVNNLIDSFSNSNNGDGDLDKNSSINKRSNAVALNNTARLVSDKYPASNVSRLETDEETTEAKDEGSTDTPAYGPLEGVQIIKAIGTIYEAGSGTDWVISDSKDDEGGVILSTGSLIDFTGQNGTTTYPANSELNSNDTPQYLPPAETNGKLEQLNDDDNKSDKVNGKWTTWLERKPSNGNGNANSESVTIGNGGSRGNGHSRHEKLKNGKGSSRGESRFTSSSNDDNEDSWSNGNSGSWGERLSSSNGNSEGSKSSKNRHNNSERLTSSSSNGRTRSHNNHNHNHDNGHSERLTNGNSNGGSWGNGNGQSEKSTNGNGNGNVYSAKVTNGNGGNWGNSNGNGQGGSARNEKPKSGGVSWVSNSLGSWNGAGNNQNEKLNSNGNSWNNGNGAGHNHKHTNGNAGSNSQRQTNGNGHSYTERPRNGNGNGAPERQTNGKGYSYPDNSANGNKNGNANGGASGNGNGNGGANGNGKGNGNGGASGNGKGNGNGGGNGNGKGNGNGSSSKPSNGNGHPGYPDRQPAAGNNNSPPEKPANGNGQGYPARAPNGNGNGSPERQTNNAKHSNSDKQTNGNGGSHPERLTNSNGSSRSHVSGGNKVERQVPILLPTAIPNPIPESTTSASNQIKTISSGTVSQNQNTIRNLLFSNPSSVQIETKSTDGVGPGISNIFLQSNFIGSSSNMVSSVSVPFRNDDDDVNSTQQPVHMNTVDTEIIPSNQIVFPAANDEDAPLVSYSLHSDTEQNVNTDSETILPPSSAIYSYNAE